MEDLTVSCMVFLLGLFSFVVTAQSVYVEHSPINHWETQVNKLKNLESDDLQSMADIISTVADDVAQASLSSQSLEIITNDILAVSSKKIFSKPSVHHSPPPGVDPPVNRNDDSQSYLTEKETNELLCKSYINVTSSMLSKTNENAWTQVEGTSPVSLLPFMDSIADFLAEKIVEPSTVVTAVDDSAKTFFQI